MFLSGQVSYLQVPVVQLMGEQDLNLALSCSWILFHRAKHTVGKMVRV